MKIIFDFRTFAILKKMASVSEKKIFSNRMQVELWRQFVNIDSRMIQSLNFSSASFFYLAVLFARRKAYKARHCLLMAGYANLLFSKCRDFSSKFPVCWRRKVMSKFSCSREMRNKKTTKFLTDFNWSLKKHDEVISRGEQILSHERKINSEEVRNVSRKGTGAITPVRLIIERIMFRCIIQIPG